MGEAFLAFWFGASIGSFLNVVADRLPHGRSLLFPASSCPACRRHLTPLELVPVLSYLALRGRCYQCHTRIPLRVLGMELLLGLGAVYSWLSAGAFPAALTLFVFVGLFVLLAAIDLEQGIIPDVLVFPATGAALALAPWWGLLGVERGFLGNSGPGHLLLGALGAAVLGGGFFAGVLVVSRGGLGWGDVKMAALIGLVDGVPGVFIALLTAILGGGLVAVVLLALRMRTRKQTMPFGPFLALGAIVGLLWASPLWRWYLRLW